MAFFENKLRFYHTTDPDSDPATWREVYPLGSKAFEWKKDKKEIFYRQGKKGDFQFSNVTEDGRQINDFDFFNEINNDLLERCKKRYIITQRNCNGTWTTEHTGKFTMNDGKWDLDKCTVELKQNLNDEYSCIKENKKEDYNILNSAPIVTTFSPVQNNFEFLSCRNKDWLNSLVPNPCDATGGWKQFFHKVAVNSPEPRTTTYTNNAADNYFNGMQGPDLAGWIEESGGNYQLQTRRYSDGDLFPITSLDAQSTAKLDVGMFGWTENALRDFRIYRPEDGLSLTIVQNHAADITWFDMDDDLKFAFYYDGTTIYAYDFSTAITRIVDTVNISTQLQTLTVELNISYGDGLLAYHDDDNDELYRYDPKTFINEIIQTGITQVKFIHSEAGFLTWYDMDQDFMYLQDRDDTTRENIVLRENGGPSRYAARENEWLVFDDQVPAGAQIAFNLITHDSFLCQDNGPGAFIPTNLTYRIENGWWLCAGQAIPNSFVAHYLDSHIPGNPASHYKMNLTPPLQVIALESPVIPMAVGIERIYIAGQDSVGAPPQDFKVWSIDQKDGTNVEVENLGPDTTPGNIMTEMYANECEQILTLSENRVHIYKENIQREDELEIWFREKITTICVGGNLTSPGAGWTIYRNQCNQFGTATWVKQPAMAAPPLIDIAEGGCVCTDDVKDLSEDQDECKSVNPSAVITDQFFNTNATFTPGTVIGPIDGKQAFGGVPRTVTWYIEKPRTGSTYTWSLIGMPGATIQSGQGTDIIIIELTSAFPGGTVSCLETNACHVGPPIAAATIAFIYNSWNGGAVTATINIPVLAETDTYSGATVRFIRAFDNPWPAGGSSSVSGESASTFGTDNKNRKFVDATHNGTSASVGWGGTQGGAAFSFACIIVATPSASLIDQPAEVCPTGQQTYEVENPRLGCAYSWAVDSPAFIIGPITGTSVLVDLNGAAITDEIHLTESCPLQPINYRLIGPCDKLNTDSWWWVIGNDVEYNRNRLLKNVIEDLVESICPEITAVRSDLFQWNPISPSLINYVYGGVNQYNYLTIAQKSDIRTPLSTGGATIGNLTWEQFAKWMLNIEVYWIIIGTELHIEHISRFKGTIGLDTTLIPLSEYANNNRQFSYAKAEMSRRETYLFEEAINAEFVGFPIEYKEPTGEFSLCVNEDTEERNWKELTTDLKFIQTNAASIALKGFVILANTFDGTDYKVIEDPGEITNIPILNSPMSVSALQERFMRWNRILPFGWMNRSYTGFDSSQFFKKQEAFKIPFCCETDFDPLDLVKTTLGDGEIESAEINFEDDTIELKLKYE